MPRRMILFSVLLAVATPFSLTPTAATMAESVPEKGFGKEVLNSIGMKLVRIPKGKFKMGSPKKEQDAVIAEIEKFVGRKATKEFTEFFRGEGQHEVEFTKEFWLGVQEVTQKQFKAVMGYNPSYFSKDGEAKSGQKYYDMSKPAGGKDKVASQDTSDFPVENVSYKEAEEFCKKLSEREAKNGRMYRLPTEAEWEYACRGGTRAYQTFHFGDFLSPKQANFSNNPPHFGANKRKTLERTSKVGSYTKNSFGLFDMHGNVYEWCADWFEQDYYRKSPGRDPTGPPKGSERVIRGGAWNVDANDCRSARRLKNDPEVGDSSIGFRVALVPSGK